MPTPQLQSSPQEDIAVVMGRFHAWDTDRKKSAAAAQDEGVRELSYEEALAYSYPRRAAKSAVAPTTPPVPANKPEEAVHSTAGQPAAAALKTAAARPADARRIAPAHAAPKRTPRATANAAAATKGKIVEQKAQPDRKPASTQSVSATVARSRPAEHKRTPVSAPSKSGNSSISTKSSLKAPKKKVRKPVASAPPAEAKQSATFHSALAACLKEAPRRPAARKPVTQGKSGKPPARQASTRVSQRVARENTRAASGKKKLASGPEEKSVSRKPVESIARTISVNLRLSKAEHDRMRRGAADADQSLATYIRESTLRFQIGREREAQNARESGVTSGAADFLEDADFDAYQLPVLNHGGPSLLTRMKNFWLGRRLTAIA